MPAGKNEKKKDSVCYYPKKKNWNMCTATKKKIFLEYNQRYCLIQFLRNFRSNALPFPISGDVRRSDDNTCLLINRKKRAEFHSLLLALLDGEGGENVVLRNSSEKKSESVVFSPSTSILRSIWSLFRDENAVLPYRSQTNSVRHSSSQKCERVK